ncbi:putative reverse transcriptase domain-containing protein, partial [Tanacetum coccineum]
VMVAPVISISFDTSEESHAPRVILFGAIPAIIPEVPVVPADPIVTPEVGTVSVVSPVGVLDLVDYSPSSDSDPSEDSLPPAPDLPLVSPFLCSDDTEADGESEPAEQRPVSSSHDTLAPLSEFPLAPVVAPPGIRRRSATLVRPGEAIPFGRPYRTHLNGPRKLLTARKRVRPILARRLAWRRVSHHSSDRHSSPDSSSSSAPSDHSLSGHTPPDTTDADSSTPQRFVHRSLARTPRHSEAFRRWRSAPLSTPYPPTTSESSLGSSSERSLDSSSPSSRPSRKRCRSPTASVPSPTHVSRSIAPTPADLLPPRKRFRDSYSPEDSGEEHMEVDTADAEAVADVGISEGVVAHPEDGVGMGFEIAASDVREDDEEFEAEASAADTREIVVDPLAIGDSSESSRGGIPDLEDTIYDIVHYMSEVRIDRITEIETTQRQLETSQMVASGERASLVERIGSLRLEYLKVRAMLSIERDRIDSIRWHMALSHEEFCQVRRDRDDTRRRLRRLESQNDSDGDNGNGGNEMVRMEMVEMEIQMRMVEGIVFAAEAPPKRLQDVFRIAIQLNGPKVESYAVKSAEKKKIDWRSYRETTMRGQVVNQRVVTCFECGRQGHFRSDCPKLKDQNRRNKAGNKNGVGEARGKAYVLGGGDANPDSYVIKGTFLLNNLYAFILFDSGADRSFVSTTFSTLLDITPDTLDVSYAVELADGRFFRQIPCLEVVR